MSILDYPVTDDIARNALQRMVSMHVVELMQANDADGKLIAPADYQDSLAGAVAWVRFTLQKYTFRDAGAGSKPKDTFVADITSVRVIIPPSQPIPSSSPSTESPVRSPKKRRVVYKTDPLTPTRRAKGKGRS